MGKRQQYSAEQKESGTSWLDGLFRNVTIRVEAVRRVPWLITGLYTWSEESLLAEGECDVESFRTMLRNLRKKQEAHMQVIAAHNLQW
jgi:hypothetical protein